MYNYSRRKIPFNYDFSFITTIVIIFEGNVTGDWDKFGLSAIKAKGNAYWKCNCSMSLLVRLSVGWSAGLQ